jgi:hypothetical protein
VFGNWTGFCPVLFLWDLLYKLHKVEKFYKFSQKNYLVFLW